MSVAMKSVALDVMKSFIHLRYKQDPTIQSNPENMYNKYPTVKHVACIRMSSLFERRARVKDLKLATCNAHWHTCIICMHPCFVCTRTSRDMYCMYAELVQVSCRKILLLPMVRMHASSRPDACALVYIHSDVKNLFWEDPSHEIMWREGRKHFVWHACPARSYCACSFLQPVRLAGSYRCWFVK